MLVIDDFGRQQCAPRDLLNRWIVPLESRVDFLTLQTGQKFELPFMVLVVFATNIKPAELVDEAFLRRIHYKVFAESPTVAEFMQIFENCLRERDMPFDRGAIEHLLQTYYDRARFAARLSPARPDRADRVARRLSGTPATARRRSCSTRRARATSSTTRNSPRPTRETKAMTARTMLATLLATLTLTLPGGVGARVGAAPAPEAALSVRITSPLGRTGLPERIRIVAQVKAPGNTALRSVRFYVDDVLLGEDAEGPPYAIEWTDENPFEPREIAVEVADVSGNIARDNVHLEALEVVEAAEVSGVLLDVSVHDQAGTIREGADGIGFQRA